MSSNFLKTRSRFWYGHFADADNFAIDFDEGGPELQASIPQRDYSPTEAFTQLQNQLTATGGQAYTVTVDRDTGIVTVSAPGTFSILPVTGSRTASEAWNLFGFTTDRTGSASYDSDVASGIFYEPSAVLKDYKDPEVGINQPGAVRRVSRVGRSKSAQFGSIRTMECNIHLITEKIGLTNTFEWVNNAAAVTEAVAFMTYVTQGRKFEFMKDKDTTSAFFKLILRETPQSRDGTAFDLSKGAADDYHETGDLLFSEVTT